MLGNIYDLIVTGKEKAIVGFFVSAILSGMALAGVSGEMTVKEAVTALCVGLLTHASVYFKPNK